MKKSLFAVVAMSAVALTSAADLSAQQLPNNLFSQYSTYGANQVEASAYPAPHPVPGYVGASWYTYQPLMPHEMMWAHARNYYNYTPGREAFYQDPYGSRRYQGGGHINVTKVRWLSSCNSFSPLPFNTSPLASWNYRFHKRRLCGGGKLGLGSHFGGYGGGASYGGSCLDGGSDYGDVSSGGYGFEGGHFSDGAGSGCAGGGCATAPNYGTFSR